MSPISLIALGGWIKWFTASKEFLIKKQSSKRGQTFRAGIYIFYEISPNLLDNPFFYYW